MKLLERFLKDELGIDPKYMIPAFYEFESRLLEWNTRMNLVSRKTGSIESHILNSVFFLREVKLSGNEKLADIGTGGGFPGIPLKIVLPGLKVTLIDSIRKKITAVESVTESLGMKDIAAVCSRAEKLAENPEFRNSFDLITAKAVAPLKDLYIWSSGLLSENGRMIFIKGGDTKAELGDLRRHAKGIHIQETKFDFDPVYGIEDKKVFTIFKY